MSVRRKDDHLKYAEASRPLSNAFADIRFIHHSLPSLSINDIDLSVNIFGRTFPYPFYINAMTGGSEVGNSVNEKLAELANHFDLPFFVGSQSMMFKDPLVAKAYEALRKTYPNLFIVANANPNFTLTMAQAAVNVLKADALAIHINSIQELVMLEGDRDFRLWQQNIKAIIAGVNVPVIVKEVGYGMHDVTLSALKELGVENIDISGTGGTNFTKIELARREETENVLKEFGRSSVESLLSATAMKSFNVFASGGITSASAIIKALALGAKAAGMAGYFLTLSKSSQDVMIATINNLILDLKKIMVLLDAPNINTLNKTHLIM